MREYGKKCQKLPQIIRRKISANCRFYLKYGLKTDINKLKFRIYALLRLEAYGAMLVYQSILDVSVRIDIVEGDYSQR